MIYHRTHKVGLLCKIPLASLDAIRTCPLSVRNSVSSIYELLSQQKILIEICQMRLCAYIYITISLTLYKSSAQKVCIFCIHFKPASSEYKI